MNCPLTPLDKSGGAPVQKKKAIDEIEGLARRFKLQGIWRGQHPNRTQYTWRDNSLEVECRSDTIGYYYLHTNITNPTVPTTALLLSLFNPKNMLNGDRVLEN